MQTTSTSLSSACDVIIADAVPLLRRGLRHVLDQENAGYCLHEAGCFLELQALVRSLSPALVITATTLPGAPDDATELLDALRAGCAALPVVAITDPATTTELCLLRLLRQGVNGLLARDAPLSDVCETVSVVLARGRFYDEQVLGMLRRQSRQVSRFTEHQVRVLHLIAKDHSNEEIAECLGSSVRTVEYHRRQMLQKVGTRSTVGLVLFALREGVLSPQAVAAPARSYTTH